ncbi:hypothetical protein [Streptomyces sp. NPDC005438]|uniref:hypothetical protein n=1 Tax=Streptomyces sp. NPDC005438 TaxID=3156880 RepID=UPI0033BA47B1
MTSIAVTVPTHTWTYGAVIPVAALAVAVLGCGLGLRCTARVDTTPSAERATWLTLGGAAVGTGLFGLQFLALMGFTVRGVELSYPLLAAFGCWALDVGATLLALFLAVRSARSRLRLLAGGLCLAMPLLAVPLLGLTALRVPGEFRYQWPPLAAAAALAPVAGCLLVWAARRGRGVRGSVTVSLLVGVLALAVHHCLLGAATLRMTEEPSLRVGTSPVESLAPVLGGPVLVLLFVGLSVFLDPRRAGLPEEHPWEGAGDGAEAVPTTATSPALGSGYEDFPATTRGPAPERAGARRYATAGTSSRTATHQATSTG